MPSFYARATGGARAVAGCVRAGPGLAGGVTMTMPTAASLRRVARLAIINAAVFVLLLAVAEGASSLLLFSVDWARTEVIAEQLHTSYDPDLGWVNRPDVHLP